MAQARSLKATGQGADVIVTDCANCGDDVGMLIECKGTTARIEVPWAAIKDGIEGAAAPVTFTIQSKSYTYPAKTLRFDAIGYVPAFNINPDDPLLAAMQRSSSQAEVRFGDSRATISLLNAQFAIVTFVSNCWGQGNAQAGLASLQQKLSAETGVLNAPTAPPPWCASTNNLSRLEATICRNPALWLLDNQMNQTYQEALGEFDYNQRKFGVQGQVAKLRNDQAEWLKTTRDPCEDDVPCIQRAYVQRIETIRPRGD
jgi:uncharacterized protein YecT (DUF1311 family)